MSEGKTPLLAHGVLTAMIKVYEIQGSLVFLNSFNRVGLDHVILVKVATTGIITHMLGGGINKLWNPHRHGLIQAHCALIASPKFRLA